MKRRPWLIFIALTFSAFYARGQSPGDSEEVFRKRGEELFQNLDVDKDGYLQGEEIPGEIRAFLDQAKARPDTRLTVRQFLEYREAAYRLQVAVSFKARDKNEDGFLQKHEIPLPLMKHLGKYSSGGDRVNFQEYLQYCRDRDFPPAAPPPPPRADPAQGMETEPMTPRIIDHTDLYARPRVYRAGKLPKGLPEWFERLDTDRDGQISLFEWRKGGKKISEFRDYDLNDDGFITADEVLRIIKKSCELKLEGGQANYEGTIVEYAEEGYRGKKHFQILTIKMEQGKTYQIDHMSKVFDAYLYLEDAEGELLAENDDGGEGLNSRIVHRAARTGMHRLIATTVGNSRAGAFSFSVRVINRVGGSLPKGLPAWLKNLDKDADGQISLDEWRKGGKKIKDFRDYDLNDDGFITADEILQIAKRRFELKLEDGKANYEGAIEEAVEERYRGKKSFQVFTINMQEGRIYQIDHTSKVFYAYLYLEDSDGEVLDKKNSGGRGLIAHIVFRAARTGIYRLIATSQDGYKSGEFTLSVRAWND
ncbi:MAG: hypothetical protein EXR98_06945 [Gemmataceae bacterium]|nr:hypothetical protein [Gemmataceae bacterium]